MNPPNRQLLEILGDIERFEARLLAWGYVDGSLPEGELLALIASGAEAHGLDADCGDVLDDFLERRLIVGAVDVAGVNYRPRAAEAVRLFARLRQWFLDSDWMQAPS